jgi:SlyX protein
MPDSFEQQIADLQTRLAFQDDTAQEMTRTLVIQQREIDGLKREMEELKRQLRQLTPSMVADNSEETLPPHY